MILFGTNAVRRLSGAMELSFGAILMKGVRFCAGGMAATLTLLNVLAIFMTVTVAFILISPCALNTMEAQFTSCNNRMVYAAQVAAGHCGRCKK